MPAAGLVLLIAVVLIVLALVFYLVSIIVELRRISSGLNVVIGGVGRIVRQTYPVNGVVNTINHSLDAGVDLLEGLLVKKAGMEDAIGLVDGLYPGSAAAGFRSFPESAGTKAPRIGEVYTKGTLTLARLGREAPIAAASPEGAVLRDPEAGSLAARSLYPENRQERPDSLARSPVIGAGSPVQYEPGEDVGGPRKRMPERAAPASTEGESASTPPSTVSWPPRTQPSADPDTSPADTSPAAAPPDEPPPDGPPEPDVITWGRR